MIFNTGPLGKNKAKMPPVFTYVGDYRYEEAVTKNGTVNWELAILSGTKTNLRFSRVVDKIDIFIVGGGANGRTGSASGQQATGGRGGNGGVVKTIRGFSVSQNKNYKMTVGGSGGGNTVAFGYTASGGSGKAGGDGAVITGDGGSTIISAAKEGQNGEYAFGAASSLIYSGRVYGSSGGGGGARNPWNSGNTPGGAAGGTRAGAGASSSEAAGGDARAHSGAGGGGGYMNYYSYPDGHNSTTGGSGSEGIIIIRNAR